MIGFQHVDNIGNKLSISSLEDNMKSLLDYSFLKIGGFIDVNVPTSGLYGGDFATLKFGYDPVLPSGCVWETPRKDWVYETGICHSGRCPVQVSGIYLNNVFLPAPTGTPSVPYRLNYRDGQVIFPTAKPSTSTIKMGYSYRYIQIYKSNESPWFKEVQQYSYNPSLINKTNGQIITANHRIQLPCIIVQMIARTVQQPYQLGTTDNIISQDVLLHVYTENPAQRDSIINMLILQKDNESRLYDINKVVKDNVNGLNYNGSLNINRLNYDQILLNPEYGTQIFYVESASITELNSISSSLYNGIVRWTIKIYP
jgi:hypothetical protein